VQPRRQLEKDANKLDAQRARSEAYTEAIIREQQGLITAAEDGLKKINSDLLAFRVRLKRYTGKNPQKRDSLYADLKYRYEYKLGERAVLQNAINIAEESISAAKLHHIPGEEKRG